MSSDGFALGPQTTTDASNNEMQVMIDVLEEVARGLAKVEPVAPLVAVMRLESRTNVADHGRTTREAAPSVPPPLRASG